MQSQNPSESKQIIKQVNTDTLITKRNQLKAVSVFPTESEFNCGRDCFGGWEVGLRLTCNTMKKQVLYLLDQHFIGFESHCLHFNIMLVASMDGNNFSTRNK